MDVEKIFHMKGGIGNESYAKNSSLQKRALDMVKSIRIDTIIDLYVTLTPESFAIADLGCSSGPNTLSVIQEIVEVIDEASNKISQATPEFRVSLNDLSSNDFNSIFTGLPDFYKGLVNIFGKQGRKRSKAAAPLVFVAGVPGTFYGRLFPANSLHFIHSSNSLHWLSKVPPAIYGHGGRSINKGNIYICESSPAIVSNAYLSQFQDDFSVFLQSRSEELVVGGRMVLIFLGRKESDHCNERGNAFLWALFTKAMAQLVSQGEVTEEKLDSYEVHFYAPSKDEIEDEVNKQGSFEIDQLEMFETERPGSGGMKDGEVLSYGTMVSMAVRAIQESMLQYHFGEGLNIDHLFDVYAKLLDEEIVKEDIRPLSFILVLRKLFS
ncbi:hypothetical protein C5167_037585 [Papaver somniferum]|uniref:Jasmonate O-methyltransferase n=1 Tax=Papaver somniferum TaxID=3469 RepID=A0A4Y7I6S9_PAPSO|nr:salicylate carboxymethyltransferase-like [Papaver somniferum]RZC44633.1 hypothetical protein C5167_037585 [Papaver somniferum]